VDVLVVLVLEVCHPCLDSLVDIIRDSLLFIKLNYRMCDVCITYLKERKKIYDAIIERMYDKGKNDCVH
jgi:hypothetical protein